MNIDHIPRPLYIAHRGVCARYPENTLSAFRGAIDAGAHMIELDLSLSKDRQLVVIHDDTVDRTTNGKGAVNAMSLAQLQQLDAGSWFDRRFAGERLPTLEAVLDAVRGHLMVNIEIKPEAFENHFPADAVERQVLDLVMAKKMHDAVLVSSFEWQVLERLRQLDKTIALGLLAEVPADARLRDWHGRIDPFSWHPDYRVLTRSQVEDVHALGVWVFPYAVGGQIDTQGLLAMGVDGLITDDPEQMRVS